MTDRPTGSRFRRGAAALAASSIVLAQEPPPRPTPFAERVVVTVRTVLVRITDAKGNPPSPPPSPKDIEVREGGIAAQVIGVDPVRSTLSPAELQRITPVPERPAEALLCTQLSLAHLLDLGRKIKKPFEDLSKGFEDVRVGLGS